jgi:hypothetical protein
MDSVEVNSLARVRITICNTYIFNDPVAAKRAVAAVLGTEAYRIQWKNVSAVRASTIDQDSDWDSDQDSDGDSDRDSSPWG